MSERETRAGLERIPGTPYWVGVVYDGDDRPTRVVVFASVDGFPGERVYERSLDPETAE